MSVAERSVAQSKRDITRQVTFDYAVLRRAQDGSAQGQMNRIENGYKT